MTQLQTLIDAFDKGERLTMLTAINKYGIGALSQRCGDLYRMGYPVDSEFIKTPLGKSVKEYFKGGVAYG